MLTYRVIKALAVALTKPEENVLLQIDEINRGNCAAIFGDIFQLLDRDSCGQSSYEIDLSKLAKEALKQEGYELPENQKVRIPANLSIIATMNTSDESVYFMDSAFKRRWQFQYISADTYCFDKDNKPVINLPSEDSKITQQANANITCCNTNDLKWDCLRRSINLFMIANAKTIRGIEDKQIGLWFVKATGTDISEADITFKLMHYLWDNVFARDKKPLRDLLTVETTEKGTDNKPIFRSRTEAELATFGQFVTLKDEFIQKVLAKCQCEKPECEKATQGG